MGEVDSFYNDSLYSKPGGLGFERGVARARQDVGWMVELARKRGLEISPKKARETVWLLPGCGWGAATRGFLDYWSERGVELEGNKIIALDELGGVDETHRQAGIGGVIVLAGWSLERFLREGEKELKGRKIDVVMGLLLPGELVVEIGDAMISGAPGGELFAADAVAMMQTSWSPTDANIPELNDQRKVEEWKKGLGLFGGGRLETVVMESDRLRAQELHLVWRG